MRKITQKIIKFYWGRKPDIIQTGVYGTGVQFEISGSLGVSVGSNEFFKVYVPYFKKYNWTKTSH